MHNGESVDKEERIRKIVILNLGGIGDVFLSTAALKSVRAHFSQAHITLICMQRAESLIADLGLADEIIGLTKKYSLKTTGILLRLRRRRPDLLLNLRSIHTYTGMATMFFIVKIIGAKKSAGKNTQGKGWFYNYKFYEPLISAKREIEHDRGFLSFLGIPILYTTPQINLPPFFESKVDNYLSALKITFPLVGIHISSAEKWRMWPLDNFSSLIVKLKNRFDCTIAITGSSHDKKLFLDLQKSVPFPLLDLCGKFSLKEMFFLLKKMQLFITNETAPMHFAAYVNCPQIVIGATEFIDRYLPLADSSQCTVLRAKVKRKHFEPRRRYLRRAFKSISVEQVFSAACEYLVKSRS